MSPVRLIGVCSKDSTDLFDTCQIPVNIDDDLIMKLQFDQFDLTSNQHAIDQTFCQNYHQFTNIELEKTLSVSVNQIKEYVPRCISCIGCRTSIDSFLKTMLEYRYQAFEPLTLTNDNSFLLKSNYRLSPEYLYSLFYIHNKKLNSFIQTIPKSKKNRRCNIHSLEKTKFLTDWQMIWNLMNEECRDELTLVETNRLFDFLENYLHKHRFCSECKLKVFEAYDLLLESNNNNTNDKSDPSKFYDGLRLCTNAKHIHIQSDENFVGNLMSRAQFELEDHQRERHAKTIETAQEEIVICIGIYLYERFEKISKLIKSEEQIWNFVFYIIVDCLRLNFETMKQDFNLTLKNLCDEFCLIDNSKSSKKPKKIKKKSSQTKIHSLSSSMIDCVEQRIRIHSCTYSEHRDDHSPSLIKSQSYPMCLCQQKTNDLKLNPCVRCSSTRTDLGYSSECEYTSNDLNPTKTVELTDRNRKVKLKIDLCDKYPFFHMDLKQIWDESLSINDESNSFISDVDLEDFLSTNSSLDFQRAKLHELFQFQFETWKQKLHF